MSLRASWIAFVVGLSFLPCRAAERPIVIAHRGASGYLPEHTLAATTLAYGLGADFIEQDVVLSQDGVPLVLHDIHIDTVTDVVERFPERHRDDGRFYALDFTRDELDQLQVVERQDPRTGQVAFPHRFPARRSRFHIATLAEAIECVQGLNQSTGREVGVYVEIKQPAWHRQSGFDISKIVLRVLQQHGYETREQPIYLQCFEQDELMRIRHELGSRLKLIQLVGANDHDLVRSLDNVARYAQGIGPDLRLVVRPTGQTTDLVQRAHEHALVVHPYTFRRDALPHGFATLEALIDRCDQAEVDGLFTDFPDVCVSRLSQRHAK